MGKNGTYTFIISIKEMLIYFASRINQKGTLNMSKKHNIKVLHISASSMIGGGPEHLWQLVQSLPKHIESFIAAPACDPYGTRFIHSVGDNRFLSMPQRKFTITALFKLISFIKQNNISIVHSHGKGAGLYGRIASILTGIKSVHTFHGIHLPKNTFLRGIYVMLERFLCRFSKACISVSDGEAMEVKKFSFAKHKLYTIYNGVFTPNELETKDMPSPFTILHVSRFDKNQKNSSFLYDIASELHKRALLDKCHFVLIGNGEELPTLKQKLSQAGLAHSFSYEGQQSSVQPYYKQAACLISTSRWEGLPLAVLEAQAFGLPAIVSNVVGNKEAIEAQTTGMLYDLDNATQAVHCIESLLQCPKTWQQMRIQAHTRTCSLFSLQNMAQKTANIYDKIS